MDVNLSCRCGAIKGVAHHVSSENGNRIICHCDDCQSFAKHIDKDNKTLDEYGGTDIFQMPIAHIEIKLGKELIQCVHVKPKGLYRWYSSCCDTPLANTMGASMPFVGIIHNFMDNAGQRDEDLGPVLGYMFTQSNLPDERKPTRALQTGFRVVKKLLLWKVKGLNKPSSFFNSEGQPISAPRLLEITD